ncbi:MAG: COX15/CtaA family protein [Planctomycetes bacterium]|nr:COX15/CtaA family protein [Planctomycetota bacterium]
MPSQACRVRRDRTADDSYNPWLHGFSVAVLVATFLLLLAGGNVTSKAAGMAVPDWPLSFQSVNPDGWTSNFNGEKPGVRDEHGHRLIGATVGFLVTVLAIWLAVREPRRWVKGLGLAALAAVIAQGVMGGLRVLDNSITLAIVHGCFAQAFFCLMVGIVAVTSRRWSADVRRDGLRGGTVTAAADSALGWACGGCVLVIYVQLILGAVLRHTQWTWIPHMSWAVVVGLALMTMARYVYQHAYARQALSRAMIAVLVLYGVQIVLGLSTLLVIHPMWTKGLREPHTLAQTWLPTVHLAVGAAILGTAAYLAVRAIGIGHRGGELTLRRQVEGVPA